MRIDTKFYGGIPPSRYSVPGDQVMKKLAQKPNRVTAVFHDSKLCFDLARGATFAQLAERLGNLGEAHGGPPLSVDVRVPVDRPL
jgi:hypothetical protein